MKIKLNKREVATILAALRYWQYGDDQMIDDIATDGDTFPPLSEDEVDELCVRINTGG